LLTVFLALSASASDYYVSPSGSDNAPGTLAQPFQTIQQAASVMVAGDTAHILAGVYRETVVPAHSGTQNAPITFMPYNGQSVTVSGADVILATSWILSSGNIYKAAVPWVPDPNLNQVFVDGQMMIEARWPNTSLDVSHPTVAQTGAGSSVDGGTALSSGTITDSNLPARPDGYWTGAVLHAALGTAWVWQTGSVTGSTSNPAQLSFTFTNAFGSGSPETPGPKNPYYLTGKLGELDTAGEFFLEAPSTIYLWTPSGDSPANHVVEVKHRQQAFNITNLSFITVQGLNIFSATIWVSGSSYVVLDNLSVKYVSHYSMLPAGKTVYDLGGSSGFYLTGDHDVLRNSTISYSSGAGVTVLGSSHVVLNNTIHDADYTPDYSSPITVGAANGGVYAYNTLYNSARFGIWHYGLAGGRILHNEVYDYGLQTNDLGCNYTFELNGARTEIAYNLCHDSHGLLLNSSTPRSVGIYLDNGSSNFVVHHNVVWNTPYALNLNVPGLNEQVYNNDFNGTISSFVPNGGGQRTNVVVENNIFVGPIQASPVGLVMANNILPGTDPQFVDPVNNNYQLLPTSPALAAGLIIPPYTNGYSGSAPDIGAYDHTKPRWKAGVQNDATISAPNYAPTLTPGSVAVVTGSVPFDSGSTALLTDGANVDWPLPLIYVIDSPPQLAVQVPVGAAPGVAIITIANGDGNVSLSSAPLFAGAPPTAIAVTQGSGQSANIGTLFPTELQATVTNSAGKAVPGAAVTFAAFGSGAGGSFALPATVTADAAGVAVAPAFLANSIGGPYAVTASAAGVGAPAVFNLTNIALLSQAIVFGLLSNVTVGAAPFTITATATSKLGVKFVAGPNAVCTVVDITVSIVGGGTCSITATQPGNTTFGSAPPVTQSFTAGAASGGPAIAQGGIGPVFSSSTTIQPGSWISIYGTNLATTTASWTGNFPTSLGGVTVTINGNNAYLRYVSPTQINLQAPDDATTGVVNATLTNASGSWTSNVTLGPISPSFSLLGGKYVAGVISRSDGSGAYGGGIYDIIGPTGNSLGYSTVAAKAGDAIELFGVGFGPTNPPVPAGQAFSGAAGTTNPVQLKIDGMLVAPSFAGLGSAGLYQINLTIPVGLGNGDLSLLATVAGAQTPSGVVISLR
jgi:uncharacterized protein (TIGR03437 family)